MKCLTILLLLVISTASNAEPLRLSKADIIISNSNPGELQDFLKSDNLWKMAPIAVLYDLTIDNNKPLNQAIEEALNARRSEVLAKTGKESSSITLKVITVFFQ